MLSQIFMLNKPVLRLLMYNLNEFIKFDPSQTACGGLFSGQCYMPWLEKQNWYLKKKINIKLGLMDGLAAWSFPCL